MNKIIPAMIKMAVLTSLVIFKVNELCYKTKLEINLKRTILIWC